MIYGAILASGKGTRIKDGIILPKQFRELGDMPIIIHTLKRMLKINKFDKIYIAVSEEYLQYTESLIKKYLDPSLSKKINIICGGKERIDTIENTINSIKKDNGVGETDIIVIHDAVRPFVTEKILNDSIEAAKKYGAVVAAEPVSDTLLISKEGHIVDEIPQRSLYYKGQSPDSFNLKIFIDLLSKITPEDRVKITGTSQVCTMNNYPIHMIPGDEINFKITTSSDIIMAKNIIKGEDYHD